MYDLFFFNDTATTEIYTRSQHDALPIYFMREMKVGDLGFFYLSQKEKAVVGVVEVIAEAHPDSTTDDERWECVDIKAVAPMPKPVTLAMCKADERLAEMALIKSARLSVQPVTADEWSIICEMGGYKT